jgi:ComF family protein
MSFAPQISKLYQGARQPLIKLVDAVLPPRCIVSGEIVDINGMISPAVWRDLSFISAPFCDICGIPFEFETKQGLICPSCAGKPPLYDQARAALVYNDQSRDLILRFKNGDQTHAVRSFTPWLRRAGADMLTRADIIIPVPLHPFRLIRRRYNQSALLAQDLSKQSGAACYVDGIRRTKHTKVQGHLTYKKRYKNVRNVFDIKEKYRGDLDGKDIVLVDDVLTTGATVNECCKVLRSAGAETISVLTVARVVRGGYESA